MVELHHLSGVDGGGDGCRAPVGEHPHVVHPVRAEGGHGAPCRRPEPDHHCGEPPAVVARGSAELQRVDHGAVAGELVVHVEHVQPERSIGAPVIHALERDHREALVDRELRHPFVLHEVRPSPQHLTVAQLAYVVELRLGKQHDIGCRDHTRPRDDRADEWPQFVIRYAEALAVALLDDDARAKLFRDAIEVRWMQRNPALVGLAGGADHAEGEAG